jgi:hypothetical protein
MKSGNHNFLETSGPLQACNGTDLPYLFIINKIRSGEKYFVLLAKAGGGGGILKINTVRKRFVYLNDERQIIWKIASISMNIKGKIKLFSSMLRSCWNSAQNEGEWSVLHFPQFTDWKQSRYWLNRGISSLQSCYGRFRKKEKKSISAAGIWTLDRPARRLIINL